MSLRKANEHEHGHGAFGTDRFGQIAERVARFFGTPGYLIGQTLIVFCWIVFNGIQLLTKAFDPYPFILLNLAFSLQAAYAAPLILLAQTRQAARDKKAEEIATAHREQLTTHQQDMLQHNTEVTEQLAGLARKIEQLTEELAKRTS